MANMCAKLINQYKFKYQLTFLAPISKDEEDGEKANQIELPIILCITDNLTQSELDNINIQWSLGNSIQAIEIKESGWIFQRINSTKIGF